MTNEEKYIKLLDLRYKLYAMPIKVVITIALFIGVMSLNNNSETMVWYEKILMFGILYSCLSTLHYFASITGNWILGLIVSIVAVFVLEYLYNLENVYLSLMAGVIILFMLVGFFALDVFRIIRYILLSMRKGEE